MKFVEDTTMVDMLVEKTVVVATCPAYCVEVTVTMTVESWSDGCELTEVGVLEIEELRGNVVLGLVTGSCVSDPCV